MNGKLPSLTPRDVIKVLRQAGFLFHHQQGSHAYFYHAGQRRWVTVPMHARSIKTGTLRSIIRQSGLTRQEFVDLL